MFSCLKVCLLLTFLFFHLEYHLETPNDSSNAMKANGNIEEKESHLVITEETNDVVDNSVPVPTVSTPTFSPETQKSSGNVTSSSKTKGRVTLIEL